MTKQQELARLIECLINEEKYGYSGASTQAFALAAFVRDNRDYITISETLPTPAPTSTFKDVPGACGVEHCLHATCNDLRAKARREAFDKAFPNATLTASQVTALIVISVAELVSFAEITEHHYNPFTGNHVGHVIKADYDVLEERGFADNFRITAQGREYLYRRSK